MRDQLKYIDRMGANIFQINMNIRHEAAVMQAVLEEDSASSSPTSPAEDATDMESEALAKRPRVAALEVGMENLGGVRAWRPPCHGAQDDIDAPKSRSRQRGHGRQAQSVMGFMAASRPALLDRSSVALGSGSAVVQGKSKQRCAAGNDGLMVCTPRGSRDMDSQGVA